MTAKPDLHTDADEWRGQWINLYSYRGGQRHLGQTITPSREAADEVRAAWFKQAEDEARNGLILAYAIPSREAFWIPEKFDQFSDNHPIVAKVKNCIFSIAIPYEPPEWPQDDDIPF